MAKLITLKPANNVKGSQVDYAPYYDEIKRSFKKLIVKVKDPELWEDDKLAIDEDTFIERIDEAFEKKVASRVGGLEDELKRTAVTIKDYDEIEVDDEIEVTLKFPSGGLDDLSGKLEIKGPPKSNPLKRKFRESDSEDETYEVDFQGLDPDSQLEKKVEDLSLSGPARTTKGRPETIKGASVYHHTIKRANKTVFYNWDGNTLKVYGIGEHTGPDGDNSQYNLEWHDGSTFTHRR